MNISEPFLAEEPSEFTEAQEEEIIFPITMENSVIFKFNEKLRNFDFDTEKNKALEIIQEKIDPGEFELDFFDIKKKCAEASPSSMLKIWVFFCAIAGVTSFSSILVFIWIILIFDFIVFAIEVYIFQKLNKAVWKWKRRRVDKVWRMKIQKIVFTMNEKYCDKHLIWKFDPEEKLLQLTTYTRTDSSIIF